jgi:hypothetical protein
VQKPSKMSIKQVEGDKWNIKHEKYKNKKVEEKNCVCLLNKLYSASKQGLKQDENEKIPFV